MAKARSVFAGLSLSEQAPSTAAPVEQRLFAPTSTLAAPQPASAPDPVTIQPAAAATRPSPPGLAVLQELDLTQLPYRKDTFLFTPDEFHELEQLKLTLRRLLDTKVTKNDLARCAIHYLVKSCKELGTESPVIQPLRNRTSR